MSWASPALLKASFFLRAIAMQALGHDSLQLEDEESLPAPTPVAMASQLSQNSHLGVADLLLAGAALQAVMEQQPLPVCDPAAVFGADYLPALAALPLSALSALVLVADLAALPAPLTHLATACLAQRSVDLQAPPPTPRCAALLQQWWSNTYSVPDFGPVIQGSLAAWRASHPHAKAANVSWRRDLLDADLAALRGLRAVKVQGCPTLTDAAIVHLAGVHTLDMSWCRRASQRQPLRPYRGCTLWTSVGVLG